MASLGDPLAGGKEYMNRGIQTDALDRLPDLSDREINNTNDAASHIYGDTDVSVSFHSSALDNSGSPSSLETSAYTHGDSDISSPPASTIKATTRTYKKQHLEFRQPSGAQTLKSISARIVSLPETTSTYSAKRELNKTKRVVSMTERIRSFQEPQVSGLYDDDISLDTLGSDNIPSRVRVHSNVTDMPHTPSPPSSPESIVFIANKNHLAEDFLRRKMHAEEPLPSVNPDGEGWITWAKSPPRPIPALHGPLSLPYARCPSGAEGTIIEEQDNLPRMIWGLEGDDVSHSRPRSDATHAPHHTTVRKATGRQQQTQAPPRFHAHKAKDEAVSPSFARMPQAKEDPRENTQQMAVPRLQHKASEQLEYEYSLPAHGPIDLTNIIRPRSAGITANAYVSELEFPNNLLYGATGQDNQSYRSSHDLDLHWQRLLLTQQGLRNSALSASNFSPNDDLVDYLQPSLSSLSLSSMASSRSPIILDPPSQMSQYSQRIPSQNMPSPRNVSFSQSPHRMSALEIAHNYRQKQLSQDHQAKHHAMLPTPPSSSSPLWSQGFSPYQESLLSPEVLAASSLSNLTVNRVSSVQQHRQHPLLQQANPLSQIRQTGYDRLGYSNFGLGKNHGTKPLLLPNARMQGRTNYEDAHFSSNAPDLSILNKMHRPQQPKRSFLPSSPVTIISQHSPVQPPRPPPNSPLASRLKPQEPRNEGPSTVVAPLSPQSPKPRLRSISQQHPRSIPLTRLIQRRLSSVPEEDAADNDSSPPCADGPSTQRTRSHSIGSATNMNPPDTFSTIRMAGNTLFASRSQDNDSVFAGMDRVAHTPETAPSVKLPGKQGKAISIDPKVKYSKGKPEDGGSTGNTSTENAARGPKGGRGHGRGRGGGGKGRKGRPLDSAPAAVNGPERVNGGMTVRS